MAAVCDPAVPPSSSRHSINGQNVAEEILTMRVYLLIAGTYTPFLLVGLDSPLARADDCYLGCIAGYSV